MIACPVGGGTGPDEADVAWSGSITKARARLGVEPLRLLFARVAGPVAQPGMPGCFWHGLRLTAIDRSTLDVPNSAENRAQFDGPRVRTWLFWPSGCARSPPCSPPDAATDANTILTVLCDRGSMLVSLSGNRWIALLAVSSACLLGGCSGGDTNEAPVATLASGKAPQSAAATNVDDQRPLVRLDATDDEKDRLYGVWERCLAANYGPGFPGMKEVSVAAMKEQDAKAMSVTKACRAQEPEEETARLRRTDLTEFKDNQREFYKCAEDAGYKLTPPDPETGEFGLTEIGPNGDFGSPKILACQREAFAD